MSQRNEESEKLLRLAGQDWAILLRILDAPEVELAGVCFHAQQCVEKSLKAVLALHGLPYERTHNLVRLAHACQDGGVTLPMSLTDLSKLNPCAVTFRYGDMEMPPITRPDIRRISQDALAWARTLVEGTK